MKRPETWLTVEELEQLREKLEETPDPISPAVIRKLLAERDGLVNGIEFMHMVAYESTWSEGTRFRALRRALSTAIETQSKK
jgi:hypothetical protein